MEHIQQPWQPRLNKDALFDIWRGSEYDANGKHPNKRVEATGGAPGTPIDPPRSKPLALHWELIGWGVALALGGPLLFGLNPRIPALDGDLRTVMAAILADRNLATALYVGFFALGVAAPVITGGLQIIARHWKIALPVAGRVLLDAIFNHRK